MSRTARSSQPIFFIGMPRSGTTVIFEAFTYHPDLAWPSVYTSRWPRWPQAEILRRILDNEWYSFRGQIRQENMRLPGNRFLPQPSEAYEFWTMHGTPEFATKYLESGSETASSTRRKLASAVEALARWQGRRRFAAKLTGPPRIAYLSNIFPDAVFVHLVRDGRAVVHSLMKVRFWREKGGLNSPFWNGPVANEFLLEWQAAGRDPDALAALQWRTIVRQARIESRSLSPKQFHEFRYEDFVADPIRQIQAMQEVCGLTPSAKVSNYLLRNAPRRDLNQKFLSEYPRSNLDKLASLMQPELGQYGYV